MATNSEWRESGQFSRAYETKTAADLRAGMGPQVIVPRGVWQGSRLVSGGRCALLGTTVAPGFDFADYEDGRRDDLVRSHPRFREEIMALTVG